MLRMLFAFAPPLNYALAMSSVRLRQYVIGSFIGLIPWALACAVFTEWLLEFLGLSWMSVTAVLTHLAPTIRGETAAWDTFRVVFVFSGLTAVAILTTYSVFRQRDL